MQEKSNSVTEFGRKINSVTKVAKFEKFSDLKCNFAHTNIAHTSVLYLVYLRPRR